MNWLIDTVYTKSVREALTSDMAAAQSEFHSPHARYTKSVQKAQLLGTAAQTELHTSALTEPPLGRDARLRHNQGVGSLTSQNECHLRSAQLNVHVFGGK